MASNPIRNLDLGTLRSFVTITDAGSMTRAAGRLFMTQSAISMQIKRLEEALGFSVFERSSQGMKTTSEGDQLYHYASQMLSLNDEIMGRLTSPDYEGEVRIGVPGDIVYPHIPDVLKAFSRDFPRVQIRLSTASTFRLLQSYDKGRHDIVLTTEQSPRKDSNILLTEPLIWTGAADGNAFRKRPLPLGFARHCAFRAGVTRALDRAGIPWVDLVVSDDEAAIEAMVTADLCVHAELESASRTTRVAIDHGGQLPELPQHSVALYSDENTSSPIVRTLATYLQRAFLWQPVAA